MEDLDATDLEILKTIEALSSIPGRSSHRGVHPEEVTEKLKLGDKDYTNRLEDLNEKGFLQVSIGWVAVLKPKGRRALQENGKSSLLGKLQEYITAEYKNGPIKTALATITITLLFVSFVLYITNNILYPDPFSPELNSSQGINESTSIKSANESINESGVSHKTDNTTVIKPNPLPRLYGLSPDKHSPQDVGITVTWTADASDSDGDPIFFRFFLNGKLERGWLEDNTWTWETSKGDVGKNLIEVWIRDGKHVGPEGYDGIGSEFFIIDPETQSQTPFTPTQLNDATPIAVQSKNATLPSSTIPAPINASKTENDSETDWIKKGDELTKQEKYSDAVKAYNEAINHNPNQSWWVWYALGTAYYKQEKYDESIPAYENATKLNSKNANAWADLGYALYNTHRYSEALQAFNKSLDLDSSRAYIWNAKGNAFYRQGNNNGSIEAFENAINREPEDANAWANLGYALYNTYRYNEALQAFNKSLDLDPSRAYVWNAKGNTLAALDRKPDADAAFAEAKERGYTG